MLASSDIDNWVALGLSVLVVLYLLGVIVFPDEF